MASTASLSRVQEADSLWFWTSLLIGSEVVLPQMVPKQEFPGLKVTPKTVNEFKFLKSLTPVAVVPVFTEVEVAGPVVVDSVGPEMH